MISSINFFVVLLAFQLQDNLALKNVALKIDPKIVQLSQNSTLYCSYELEPNDILYSVKWYRGSYEFYRYTPSEQPSKKMFPKQGITIDMDNSNGTQVRLTNIEFKMAGNFTCEVTTEAPLFSTRLAVESMSVVKFPEYPPKISVGTEPLDYGDELHANCSTPPSRPPVMLQFILNNLTVASSEPLMNHKYTMKPVWSDLSLRMELDEHHFDRGRLILRCVAHIPEIYHEEAILELDSVREPISQRVSAVDSAVITCITSKFMILLLAVYHLLSLSFS